MKQVTHNAQTKKRIAERAVGFARGMISGLRALVQRNILLVYLIIVVGTVFVALFLPYSLPDFLRPADAQAARMSLSVVGATLASIFGIVVAVLLVALQILRKTLASYRIEELFQISTLKRLTLFFMSSILICIVSIASLGEKLSTRSLNLWCLSVLLFVFCVIVLYWFSREIIIYAGFRTRVQNLVKRIDLNAINEIGNLHFGSPHLPETPLMSENPILVISDLATRTVREGDHLATGFILEESTSRLLDLIAQPSLRPNARAIINAFSPVMRNCALQAITDRQEQTLARVLHMYEKVHNFCAKNSVPWDNVIELNHALQDIVECMMRAGLDDMAGQGFSVIEHVFLKHLTSNVPLEDEIWSLHTGTEKGKSIPPDDTKSRQWDYVATEYARILRRLVERAIALGKPNLVRAGITCFGQAAYETIQSNLGILQKQAVLKLDYWHMKTLTIESGDKGLSDGSAFAWAYVQLSVAAVVEKNPDLLREPLLGLGDTLVRLAEKHILHPFDLVELGAAGRNIIERIGRVSRHIEAIKYVCAVFDKIREIYSEEDFRNIENRKVYLEVFEQVSSLKKCMELYNKSNDVLRDAIDNVLNKFGKRDGEAIQSIYGEKERIEWPTLD